MASVAAINNLGPTADNPRGNLWFNDDSTFGHKLLMKMGWQRGKGLGKNEDGIKENVKVKVRSTNSGLGFKDDAYTNVMKNEYESLLKNLKPQYSSKVTVNPTKETVKPLKSKVMKNRLRYPKLYFGKDVAKYSEKDMKSIFICSQQIGENKEKEDRKVLPQKAESENSLSEYGDTIKSNLSVSEYFAMKMKEKKKGSISKPPATVHSDQQTSFESNESKIKSLMHDAKLSSKRKRLEMSADEEYSNELNLQSPIMEFNDIKTENSFEVTLKSSSKKRKRNSEKSKELDEENPCTIGNKYRSADENHQDPSSNSLEVSLCTSNENKEKSLMAQNECSAADTTGEICENFDNSELCMSSKKKKKKNRHTSSTAVDHSLQEPTFIKEKPFENYKSMNALSFSKSIDREFLSENIDCLQKKNKRKKKKLKQKLKSCIKSKKDSYSMKNVSFNENVTYRVIDSDIDSIEGLTEDQSVDQVQLFSNEDSITTVSLVSVDGATANESSSSSHDDINLVKQLKSDKCDEATSMNEVASDKIIDNSDSCIDMQNAPDGKSNEASELFSLPSSKSPYYNFWIESQRQALKMNAYKQLLKNIETHDVLRTTNLLSIQGYGNWGF